MSTRKVAPITPQEIEIIQQDDIDEIPDAVIECFNSEIKKNFVSGTFSSGCSIVQRDVIKSRIKDKIRDQPFRVEWLNIEPLYEQAGWTVRYERPTHGFDTYLARFIFTPK